jgi:pantoate--beta-alanine ligase
MTRLFDTVAGWQGERRAQLRRGSTLGFVPTMGALHDGHISLVQRSRDENDRTLVSVFVNRTQFDDPADFTRYPRTLDADLRMLEGVGADYVLVPTDEQLYPDRYAYRVSETDQSRKLEGACRPGHFEGVLTVVLKLLLLAAAQRAYFGEKDWQQLTLIRGLVDAFFVPTVIVGCPTVREHDGLAMSSRNRRLPPGDRAKAARLHQALRTAAPAAAIADTLTAEGFAVDYVEDWGNRRVAAVRLSGVRLLDNVPIAEAS